MKEMWVRWGWLKVKRAVSEASAERIFEDNSSRDHFHSCEFSSVFGRADLRINSIHTQTGRICRSTAVATADG